MTKTLNNIQFRIPANHTESKLGNRYIKDELRYEAIKHIKELIAEINFKNKRIKELDEMPSSALKNNISPHERCLTEKKISFEQQIGRIDSQIAWIKCFFNLEQMEWKEDGV